MKHHKILYIIALLLFVGCNQKQKEPENQTHPTFQTRLDYPSIRSKIETPLSIAGMQYEAGGGLGGTLVDFKTDGTFKCVGFCDICPGSYSFGHYTESQSLVIMRDTLCYSTHPHYATPEDTVYCEELEVDTFYKWVEGETVLLAKEKPFDCKRLPERSVHFWKKREQFSGLGF